MPYKVIIGDKGKAWKLELEGTNVFGKSIGDKIKGEELNAELSGYEFEITGGSDTSGFPLSKDVEGIGLKRLLLKKGWGMKQSGEGLRLRKTVRGKVLSETIAQINLKVVKKGNKALVEVFPDQNKPKEEKKVEVAAPTA